MVDVPEPRNIEPSLAAARQLQHAGRHADAARCYHALLAREPNHADALHEFGVMHHRCGYPERAIELIGRAVSVRPMTPAYHANLAEAHRALGQYQQALDCCHAALRLQSDYPEARNNLGLALHDLGRHAEAVEQFRAALRVRPEFALAQNNLGTSLGELGQTEEAVEAFRAAVSVDPDHALARSNLGQLLVDRGQAEEALPHCLEAVRLQPNLAAAHNNLGNAFRALERWPEAHAAYDEALRLAPNLARVQANRGLAFHRQGDRASAFACLRRAVELAPYDVEMWRQLAGAHVADEDHAAAVPCCRRIVALKPDHALGHNDLGWALQQEGRYALAADCYRRALELQPGQVDAIMNQGSLHEELGELTEAEACYRRARSASPRSAEPLARLATLLRGKLPDADREAIRAWLESSGRENSRWERGPLLFGLVQILDAQGEYAEAAACLAESNALALQQRRRQGRVYDPAAHSSFVDGLHRRASISALFSRLSGVGDETRRPVFVFGLPRSGTTLVEQVLASHSRVHGAGELRLAQQGFDSVPVVLARGDDMHTCLNALRTADVRELAQRHRQALEARLQGAGAAAVDRIVDKMPDNYLYLGLLALLFPRATFIHVRRDLRDVAVSCWMTNFRSIRWANHPEHLAGRIRNYQRVMGHWQAVLPVAIHEVVYERLVNDFEVEARHLVSACGLEWQPACSRFHQTERPVRTASVTQVRQPLYRRSLARWKHYEIALAELFGQLAVS